MLTFQKVLISEMSIVYIEYIKISRNKNILLKIKEHRADEDVNV